MGQSAAPSATRGCSQPAPRRDRSPQPRSCPSRDRSPVPLGALQVDPRGCPSLTDLSCENTRNREGQVAPVIKGQPDRNRKGMSRATRRAIPERRAGQPTGQHGRQTDRLRDGAACGHLAGHRRVTVGGARSPRGCQPGGVPHLARHLIHLDPDTFGSFPDVLAQYPRRRSRSAGLRHLFGPLTDSSV